MQTKIIHLPPRRRNTEQITIAEIRALRLELAELRKQVADLTPPAPWGLEKHNPQQAMEGQEQ